jgi:alanine racemase
MEYDDPRAVQRIELDKNALIDIFELFGKTLRESRLLTSIKHHGDGANLRPVITRKTSVRQLPSVVRHEAAGYDRTSMARASRELAENRDGNTVGYSSTLGNRRRVVFRRRSTSVGWWLWRNILMADVTGMPGVSICDEMPVEEIAQLGDTITTELLTRLSAGNPLLAV